MSWKQETREIRQSLYGYYCNAMRESGIEPIPFSLFDRIEKLDVSEQLEYTKWFWNERGNYHE